MDLWLNTTRRCINLSVYLVFDLEAGRFKFLGEKEESKIIEPLIHFPSWVAHSHFDYNWSRLNFRIPSHDCITLNACSHGPAVNKYLHMETKEKNWCIHWSLFKFVEYIVLPQQMYLLLFFWWHQVIVSCRSMGMGTRHLVRDLEMNFCIRPFCIGSVSCLTEVIILLGKTTGNLKQKHKWSYWFYGSICANCYPLEIQLDQSPSLPLEILTSDPTPSPLKFPTTLHAGMDIFLNYTMIKSMWTNLVKS